MSERRTAIIGRVFGLGAGLSYGVSAVLIRQGLGEMAPPLVGAAIAMLAGTLGLTVLSGHSLKSALVGGRKAIVLLLSAGIMAALGIIASFFALSMAPVVVVSPVQSTTPLFALLWSWLFLGHLEKITPRLVLGCVLVVSGITLITLGRNL